MFGTLVSDMQEDITVENGAISGTLKYLSEGELADYWGAGNFLALKFTDIDPNAISVKVGLDPSYGSGLVEIIDDPDKNGAWKITDNEQVFKVVTSNGVDTVTDTYDLSNLLLLEEENEVEQEEQ